MHLSDISASVISAVKATSITEWLIFITALAYVLLAAIESTWCWLFGIISSALSVYLCYSGQLFLESGLNIFYVIIGAYGWYQWLYGSASKTELPVVSSSLKKNLFFIFIGLLIWIPFGYTAHRFSTQAMPYLDAFITSFSIVATWMTAKKILENWLYWIVIDALAVFLYGYREFYLIALLYIIYTILALAGYIAWRKKLNTSSASHL
ncbi:MAG: nicotinamide mononucleotide transporter PnuC [Bacteroidetes bacterium]|nr:nicotinamide mononucleotide transporter PnuC [Bacteroidota bacterium]